MIINTYPNRKHIVCNDNIFNHMLNIYIVPENLNELVIDLII